LERNEERRNDKEQKIHTEIAAVEKGTTVREGDGVK
jgi:hypothetical protein